MIKIIEKGIALTGKAVSWLTTGLVVLVCVDVFRRYILMDSAAWIIELEWHLFALIFMLAAGWTLQENKHVRVDLFYDNFSMRDKAWVNLIGSLLFLVPWCIVIFWVSLKYAHNSFIINEGSPDPGGLPARYMIKFAISGGFFLLLLQALILAWRSYTAIKTAGK